MYQSNIFFIILSPFLFLDPSLRVQKDSYTTSMDSFCYNKAVASSSMLLEEGSEISQPTSIKWMLLIHSSSTCLSHMDRSVLHLQPSDPSILASGYQTQEVSVTNFWKYSFLCYCFVVTNSKKEYFCLGLKPGDRYFPLSLLYFVLNTKRHIIDDQTMFWVYHWQ